MPVLQLETSEHTTYSSQVADTVSLLSDDDRKEAEETLPVKYKEMFEQMKKDLLKNQKS